MGVMNRIKGAFRRISVIGEIFEGRDPERHREMNERAQMAMQRVESEPIRQVEDSLRIDQYAYPTGHSGYATHERNRRPVSRSEELERQREAEESLQKRLESVTHVPQS